MEKVSQFDKDRTVIENILNLVTNHMKESGNRKIMKSIRFKWDKSGQILDGMAVEWKHLMKKQT